MNNIAAAEAAYLREAQDLYEYQQRAVSEVAHEYAELAVLGDMDTLCDELGSMASGRRDGAEQSQRAARVVSRLDECDLDVLLGAALICAHQQDDEMALHALKTLAARYLKAQASYIDKIVSENT
mgnify:FL=1